MESYNLAQLKNIFKAMDYQNTQSILIHSALQNLGVLEGINIREIPQKLLEVFMEETSDGALVLPAFNYDFPKTRFVDLRSLKSVVGILSEEFRKIAKVRSNHPMFNFCASGKRSDELLCPQKMESNPFVKDSVYGRLYEDDCLMAFFGTDIRMCTFMVFVEVLAEIQYRYFKAFNGELIGLDSKSHKGDFYHFCMPLAESQPVNFFRVQEAMIKKNIVKILPLGAGFVYYFRAKAFTDFIKNAIKKEPFILLENPPKHYYIYENGEEKIIKTLT